MSSHQTKTAPLRCWVEINLEALNRNADLCRSIAGCPIMAIIKADAYGHGLEEVARELSKNVGSFGVANLREALRIKETLPALSIPILILSPATPVEIPKIIAEEFAASVSTHEEVVAFEASAAEAGKKAILHVVADTGMGRMGSAPDQFASLVKAVQSSPHCTLTGVNTHFPSADEDSEFTGKQIARFSDLLENLTLPKSCEIHVANSAGLLGYEDLMPFATTVRPGLALYGISPFDQSETGLLPVLEWKTVVTLVRDIDSGTSISYGRTFISKKPMRVATLGIGYGDGYPRHLSGQGASVLIAGKRCPILGRITMDQVVVDISHLDETVKSGDEATVIGSQADESITVSELADRAGTIPWAIFSGITSRVEKTYLS